MKNPLTIRQPSNTDLQTIFQIMSAMRDMPPMPLPDLKNDLFQSGIGISEGQLILSLYRMQQVGHLIQQSPGLWCMSPEAVLLALELNGHVPSDEECDEHRASLEDTDWNL